MRAIVKTGYTERLILMALCALTFEVCPKAENVILETASMGPTGNLGGFSVGRVYFLGHRFHVDQPTLITQVGGHFASGQNGAGGTLFAAIARLSGPSAFPVGLPFAPGEVLGSSLITIPTGSSKEILVPLPMAVQQGDYLLVFGSGQFGASGEGSMTSVNPALASTEFTIFSRGGAAGPVWLDAPLTDLGNPGLTLRMVVEAVPEPRSVLLGLMGGVILLTCARKRATH
jgi:hypothetical protein